MGYSGKAIVAAIVLGAVLSTFNSVLNSATQENIERVLQSNSLLSITNNPELADEQIVYTAEQIKTFYA